MKRTFPGEAKTLHAALEVQFNTRYEVLARMADPSIVCEKPETAEKEPETSQVSP